MLIPARLTRDAQGVPFSEAYGDVYHSVHGGPAQSRHVFLGGNDLPARWQQQERFVILETGFGLGLNFLTTWQAWQQDPQRCRRLHFVSIEKHPFPAGDLAEAHAAWPAFAALSAELRAQWPALTPGIHRLTLAGGAVILTLVFGDAASQLRAVDAAVDAFFLDGFSPARNPELWSPAICQALARLAAPGATLATWSVAGAVRNALEAAEFALEKRPGFAGKREMLSGRFRSRRPPRHAPPTTRQALVIGAGIAGCSAAERLANRGWQVTVLDATAAPGQAASGNLAGMLRPLPSADDNRLSRLTRAGFLATRRWLATLPDVRWEACGVLHLARDAAHEAQQARAIERLGLPETLQQYVDAATASRLLGQPVPVGGWWFPEGGWVQPPSVCRAALAAWPERIHFRPHSAVDRIEWQDGQWQAVDAQGDTLAAAPTLIMASGAGLKHFPQFAGLPQIAARGQVTHIPEAAAPDLPVVCCRFGYVAPIVAGWCLTGATLQPEDPDPQLRLADHEENLGRLQRSLPGLPLPPDLARLGGKVGFRPMSPDRLPMVGAAPAGPPAARLPQLARAPGLWCVQGFGARGIVWSALMAELLASRLEGDPLPLENDLVDAVDPGRFLVQAARR